MKEYDLILNMLANQQSTITDLQTAGFSAENTRLRSEEEYLNSEKITNRPEFQGEDGQFDKDKFHRFYVAAGYFYNQLATQDYDKAVLEQAQYSKDNMWVDPKKRTLDYTKLTMEELPNPDMVTFSLETIGQRGTRKLSQSEIAQTQKVYNVETGEWTDSPNDSFFGNFTKTLVLATYDEDEFNENGELIHQKGERKLNEDGLPYYETLGGRNVYGREVLNKFNTLTVDDSFANHFDFFDTDDIEQKSVIGTVMRNATLVGSMFLPYVGPWIAGISVATQTAGILANLGKLFYGEENETLNNIVGWTKSVNRQGQTEYAAQNTWSMENIINMIGDTVGQLKEQRWVFNKATPFLTGNTKALKILQENKEKGQAFYQKYIDELADELSKKGAAKTAKDFIGDGKLTLNNLAEMKVASNAFTHINKQRAAKIIDQLVDDATSFGGHLSMAYMTGLVVQDTYSEAIAAGASHTEAVLLTLGYAGAEFALLNTGLGRWNIPEMDMRRVKHEALAEAFKNKILPTLRNTTKNVDKQTFVTKALQFGKDLWQSNYAKQALSGSKMIMQNAAAESLEEVSEEILADFAKSTLNVARWLQGEDPLNMGQWENMFDRYGMSALGGFVGGGIASAGTNFKAYRDISNMDATQAMHEILYMVNNDKDEDFIKSLEKMTIGNKHLSATKIIDSNEDGSAVVYGEGTIEDNQDKYIKDYIKKQVGLVRDFLQSEGAKISTQSLLDKLTLEDQQEFQKYHRFARLQSSRAMNMYLEDFAEAQSALVAAKGKLWHLENGTSDSQKNDPSYEEAIKRATKEVEKHKIKIDAYTSGTMAPGAIKDAIFEMNPMFHLNALKTTVRTFAKAETGKDWEQLSEAEQKRILTKYKVHNETVAKNEIHTLSELFHNMVELYTPHVQAAQEFLQKVKEEGITYDRIFESIQQIMQSKVGNDPDAYLQNMQKLLGNMEGLTTMNLVIPFLSQETHDILFDILNAPYSDDILNDEKLIEQEQIRRNREASKIIESELLNNIDVVVSEFIDLGYIHPEIKKAVVGVLKLMPTIIQDQLEIAREDFISENFMMSFEEQEKGIQKLIQEANVKEQQIEEYLEQIEKLDNTPVIDFLNKFQISVTESNMNLTKHLDKVFKVLDETKDLDELFLEEDFLDDNQEAINLVTTFISVLEGMKVDNADILNPTGYSKILNEVYKRQGIKNYVELAELDSETANMIIQDAELVLDRLNFIQGVHNINKGNKLKEHDVVQVNRNFLLYNQTQRLINVIPDDWIADDEGNNAKIKLDALHKSLETLKGIKEDNLKLSKEDRRKANAEMLKLENAIYDIFSRNVGTDHNKLKNLINNFAGENGFFQPTGDVLNTATKFIEDNAYIWWLASRAALKGTAFYQAYSKSLVEGLAPIPSQDLGTYLGVAAAANMDVINAFTRAYKETMVETFNSLSEDRKKEVLKTYRPGTEAFATDLLNYFASFEGVPQFENMVFFEGIPGSGKSGGVYRGITAIVGNLDPTVLENAIYAHTTEKNAKDAADNIGLKKYQAMDKEKLMKYISDEWRDVSKNPVNPNSNTYYLYDDSYEFVDGTLKNKWKINKVSDAPRVMYVDEITHYNQQELSMLEQFAKENGTILLLAGDMDQSKLRAYTTKVKYKGTDIDVSISRNYFPRIPKIGLTLRTLNRQMNHSVLMMQKAMNDAKKGGDIRLNFTYLEDNKEHPGLFGVKVTEDWRDAKDTIDTIFQTATDKVGFVYHDENSELYKYLTENYGDKIDPKHVKDAQGREGQYYIIEPDLTAYDTEFVETLYTGITRSEQGALVISPSDRRDSTRNPVGKVKLIQSVADPIYQILSWRDQLQKVSEQGRKDLEELVKDLPEEKIEFKKPTTTSETSVTTSTTESVPPPVEIPPVVPPTPLKGISRDEAQRIIDDFDNTYLSLTNPTIIRNSDGVEMGDIHTEVQDEGDGSYTPKIKFDDGTEITMEEFNKNYQLINKDTNIPVPLYEIGQKLTIDESGTVSNIIINDIDATKNPIEYTISNLDGTNTRTITQPELQAVFKEEYSEGEPPKTESEFLPDDGRDDGSDSGFMERVVTEENATQEEVPEKGNRLDHKAYSFNAYEMGISWDGSKIVYDETPYDDGSSSFDNRIDNAIGLIHLWGLNPKTITKEQYQRLEKAIADIHNIVESKQTNAEVINYLKMALRLDDTGDYNLIYAIKNTAGEQKANQSAFGKFFQGLKEKLLHIRSKDPKAHDPKKQKIVMLLKNGKDTVFEMTVSTLNSPLTRMQDRDADGNLIFEDVYNAYTQAFNEYRKNNDDGLAQHLAINDIIDTFDGKSPKSAKQDLINLFKLYQFNSNGIFYLGNVKNGLFSPDFVYGKSHNYGVQLVKRRGDNQLNGQLQFGNPEQNIDTDEFIDLEELAKDKRLHISSIMSANQDLEGIHKNHAIVLVSTDPELITDEQLIKAYLEDSKKDKKDKRRVSRFYVLPPETTSTDWLEDQHNFFLKNTGHKVTTKGIGNQFTSYRVLQKLIPTNQLDIASRNEDGTTPKGLEQIITKVKESVDKLNKIEEKWNSKDVSFDEVPLTNGQTDKQWYEFFKSKYISYPNGEQWARRQVRILEQKFYLDSANNWDLFSIKNDKTISQALSHALVKLVWRDVFDPTTLRNNEVKNNRALSILENATQGYKLFFKNRKSKEKLGPKGEFTKIITQGSSAETKYTAFVDKDGKKFKYKINAKIDTPTRGFERGFLSQKISYIVAPSKHSWNSVGENGATHRSMNFYYDPLTKVWKLTGHESDPSKKSFAQRCLEDYLGINSIMETLDPAKISTSNAIKNEYSRHSWMDFDVLDDSKSKVENLRALAAANQGNGRFLFENNGRLYVTDVDKDVIFTVMPNYIENSTDDVVIQGSRNGLPVKYELNIVQDTSGNIQEVRATETHYIEKTINQESSFGGITDSQYQSFIQELSNYNDSKKVPMLKVMSRWQHYKTLGELLTALEQYQNSGENIFGTNKISPINLTTEINDTIRLGKLDKIGNQEVKEVGEKLLKATLGFLDTGVLNNTNGVVTIENNNYPNVGDIIMINGVRIQIEDVSNLEILENLDNYLLEETICTPKIWKII